jgi:DNA-directed RNA polymerase specialized sigma24 family protein
MRTLTTQAVDSTMIAIFLSSQQYDPTRSSFITWCSSIAKNQILQLYKGRNKELAFDMQTHEKFHFIPQSEDDSELQMKRQVEALIEFLEEDTDPMAKLMLAKFNGQQYITNEDGNHLKYNSLKTKIRAYKKKIRLHFKNNVLFNNII